MFSGGPFAEPFVACGTCVRGNAGVQLSRTAGTWYLPSCCNCVLPNEVPNF